MARQRWFYAQGGQRKGPVSPGQLVESLLKLREPRAVLVWRKGLVGWTRAGDVSEVEREIGPVLARREAESAARRAPAPAPAERPTPPPPRASPGGNNPLLLYGGLATGVVVTGLVAWLLWPRSEVAPAQVVPLGGTTAENAPAVVIPAPAPTAEASAHPAPTEAPPDAAAEAPTPPSPKTAAPPPAAPAGVGDEETDVPAAELRKLRQVAAWSDSRLELTVVNNTDWRITELSVQVQRFAGNEVVEEAAPILLRPPPVKVDDEVASLLGRVAPDRRKPGVNPLDTGTFSGEAGPRPEGFRCEIVSARGYPPR
jgi:hypothetical protein